jgi:hypothetical protein
MSSTFLPSVSLFWVGSLMVAASFIGPALCGAEPTAAPSTLAIPKSIFVDDAKVGKDPFFPNTARRAEKAPSTATQHVGSIQNQAGAFFDQLKLKGILGNATRRLALINNHTFEAGEQAEIRITEGRVKVRCLEIRDHSVIIILAGENQRRELYLNEKP